MIKHLSPRFMISSIQSNTLLYSIKRYRTTRNEQNELKTNQDHSWVGNAGTHIAVAARRTAREVRSEAEEAEHRKPEVEGVRDLAGDLRLHLRWLGRDLIRPS